MNRSFKSAAIMALSIVALANCSGSDKPAACPVGSETCSCYGNGTCDTNLECRSRLCVASSVGASGANAQGGRSASASGGSQPTAGSAGSVAGGGGGEPGPGPGGAGGSAGNSAGPGGAGGDGPSPSNACANNKKDSNESDVDCGGGSKCDRCVTSAKCTTNSDCQTSYCKNKLCTEPTCFDKVKNQDETAVDCGGSCQPCDIGVACSSNDDCTGQYCLDGVCDDHCTSGVREADETDKDCGGSCKACADKLHCIEAADCTSLICSNNACSVPTCSDQVKNQDESDKDCGGVCFATKPCPVSARCTTPADCESWICSTAGKCLADTVVVTANAVIDDFEDGDLLLPALEGRVGNWYAYGDGTGVVTEDVFAVKRGISKTGLHGVGKGFTSWGSGVGVDLNNLSTKQPYDASAYTGVTFWARAASAVAVTLALPDIDTDNLTVGKTCTTCDHHYFKTVQLSTTWQRFMVAFADLSLDPGGAPTPVPAFKPSAMSSVQFRIASGQDYDVYFDDIAFVK